MKKHIALVLVALLVFSAVSSSAWASTSEEDYWELVNAYRAEINRVEALGHYSSEHLNQSVIDLVYVSQGTVTSYVYTGKNQNLTVYTYNVDPQPNPVATDKITRFIFQIRNMYHPENVTPLQVSQDRNTVRAWSYGPQKDEAMGAIIFGLEECLNNKPIQNNSNRGGARNNPDNAWLEKYSPEQIKNTMSAIAKRLSLYTAESQNLLMRIISKVSELISEQ